MGTGARRAASVLVAGACGCGSDWQAPVVRVHLLSAPAGHALDGAGSIDDAELDRRLGAINEIFDPVGVQWQVESVVTTPARRLAETTARLEGDAAGMATLLAAIPESALLSPDGWDLVVVRRTEGFGFGGVFGCGVGGAGGPAAAVVPVEDSAGRGQQIRKWAHELGHAAGLGHTPCTERFADNLMMSGKCDKAVWERRGFTEAQRAQVEERLGTGRPMRCR